MQEIELSVTVSRLEIGLAVTLLMLAAAGYAWLVRFMRRRDPEHGYTAALVVVGVAMVGVALTAVTNLQFGALMAVFFAAAGVPMVWEYTDARLSQAERKRLAENMTSIGGSNGVYTEGGGALLGAKVNHRRP